MNDINELKDLLEALDRIPIAMDGLLDLLRADLDGCACDLMGLHERMRVAMKSVAETHAKIREARTEVS